MKQHRLAKILVIIALGLVLLFVIALRLVDVVAKSVIDSQVTEILGVESRIGGVSLGVLTSRSTFSDITVKNPPGFDREFILTVGKAEIDCGITTLMSDNIDIPHMMLDDLQFDLEEIDTRINLEILIKHIQKYVKNLPPSNTETNLDIQELQVSNVYLTARGKIVTAAGGKIDQKIPGFTVTNIGTKANTEQMTSQFISILTHVVLSHVFKHPIDGLSGMTVSSINSVLGKIPIFKGIKDIGGALWGGEEEKDGKDEKPGEGKKKPGD